MTIQLQTNEYEDTNVGIETNPILIKIGKVITSKENEKIGSLIKIYKDVKRHDKKLERVAIFLWQSKLHLKIHSECSKDHKTP